MKKNYSALLCIVTFMCLLLSCQKKTAFAQESEMLPASLKMNQASKMVPIKGTYVTTIEMLNPPPMLRQRITGTGQSSHLGEGTFVAISTLNLTTAPPFHLNGTATFYGANGDAFYTSFTGISTPIGGGKSDVVINQTITGGTGRFLQASGNFVGYTIANPALPTAIINYEGSISY